MLPACLHLAAGMARDVSKVRGQAIPRNQIQETSAGLDVTAPFPQNHSYLDRFCDHCGGGFGICRHRTKYLRIIRADWMQPEARLLGVTSCRAHRSSAATDSMAVEPP